MYKKQLYSGALGFVLILCFSFNNINEVSNDIQYLTTRTLYEAGSTIILNFSTQGTTKPFLYCSNSYGSTLITPTLKDQVLQYRIPNYISEKSGVVNWKLTTNALAGELTIIPKTQAAVLETYIGPPSIEAGGKDHAMLVTIPTDSLDNPLKDSTQVRITSQFLSNIKDTYFYTKNKIAYTTIFSPKKTGRMLFAISCLNKYDKEFDLTIMPAIPIDFTISAMRNHNFADGNQITSFKTSVITDIHKNLVSDGTFVTFFIINKAGNVLKTYGTTINGVAEAYIVHPDHEEQWDVKAMINGISESNTLTITYEKVIDDIKINFSNDNRTIIVGPIKSFMNQIIPDGLPVRLSVIKNGKQLDSFILYSKNGLVNFTLKQDVFKKGSYTFQIYTAGIKKIIKKTLL